MLSCFLFGFFKKIFFLCMFNLDAYILQFVILFCYYGLTWQCFVCAPGLDSCFFCFCHSPWQWKHFILLYKMNLSTSKLVVSVYEKFTFQCCNAWNIFCSHLRYDYQVWSLLYVSFCCYDTIMSCYFGLGCWWFFGRSNRNVVWFVENAKCIGREIIMFLLEFFLDCNITILFALSKIKLVNEVKISTKAKTNA